MNTSLDHHGAAGPAKPARPGRHDVNARRRGARGYTLVEVMVVITIIAILAALTVPRFIGFTRTAETALPVSIAARIAQNVEGYLDARPSQNVTIFDGRVLAGADAGTANTLTLILPQVWVEDDHGWVYTIAAGSDTTNDDMCISIVSTDPDLSARTIFFSSTSITEVDDTAGQWDEHTHRIQYIAENTTAPVNSCGSCTTAGTQRDSAAGASTCG